MPTHRTRTPFHVFRSSTLATGILTLAAGAHLAGGAQLPAPGILLAVLALTALVSTAATRLRLAFPAMAALLGAGQLVLHEIFTAFGRPGLAAAPGFPLDGHQHAGSHAASAELAALAAHVSPADPGSAPLMLAAHAVATLGCALLLARGEAALWALAAWLRPLAALPQAVTPTADSPVAETFPPDAAPRRPWRNLRQDNRRGPPSAVVLPS
ncbi:hypothetical protein [Arthrobacter sp. P2b]|uniref:hypothetical protein n=1 Tax=Arthrobacter sp. P2b TaxID=1938741 RepID=UPI0009A59AA7|nr:hypothetical protein [Arthrobacter sp. P2b]SLK09793.1 hypothetical protein SAMN06272721_1126 [Arthrobacter sp. P2b]